MSQSNAEAVLTFTMESGTECPDHPKPMNRTEVAFLIKMVISELDELACTVSADPATRDALMLRAFNERDRCKNFDMCTSTETMANQADALVDSWYYSLNVAARHGINLSRIFQVVHNANMAKRDPTTGKFLRRESDGKIIKPDGWTAPDILSEIRSQLKGGSWEGVRTPPTP